MSTCGTWACKRNALRGDLSSYSRGLGILNRIYPSLGENHEKIRTATSTNMTGNLTWHLSSTNFERRTALPLVGLQKGHQNCCAKRKSKYNPYSKKSLVYFFLITHALMLEKWNFQNIIHSIRQIIKNILVCICTTFYY